jgi:hypothetical protein
LGDCDVDGPGGYYNGDGQAEIRIAEDYADTSDVDLRLILGLEKDWAALDSSLCYSLLAVDMRRTTRFVTVQRRIVARVRFC